MNTTNRDKQLLLNKKKKIEEEMHKYDLTERRRLPQKLFFHNLREEVRNYRKLGAISFALQLVDGKTLRDLDYKALDINVLPQGNSEYDRIRDRLFSNRVSEIINAVTEILQISLPVCKKSIQKYIVW